MNKLYKRLVSVVLTLATAVSSIPIVPVQAASYTVDTAPSYKGFINLADVSDDIIIDMQNAKSDNWVNTQFYDSNTALVTKEMAQSLLDAQAKFSAMGYTIKIWDAYRPMSVQAAMNQALAKDIGQSLADAYIPAVSDTSQHSRGIAVDMTLVDNATGKELAMPSAYCDFSDMAGVDPNNASHSSTSTATELANEKILYNVMDNRGTSGGVSTYRLSNEWWHFFSDVFYDDNFDATYPKQDFTFAQWFEATGTTSNATPVAPAVPAYTMPTNATLDIDYKDAEWYSPNYNDNFYMQYLGIKDANGKEMAAICYEHNAVMNSNLKGTPYTLAGQATSANYPDFAVSQPFLDWYTDLFYAGGLSDADIGYMKSFVNAISWLAQDGTFTTQLLTDARAFDKATTTPSTAKMLYNAAKELNATRTAQGLSHLDDAVAMGFISSIVSQWDKGAIPHRSYYVYTSSQGYQKLLVSNPVPDTTATVGYLALRKVDGETQKPLPGAKFTAYYDSACTQNAGDGTTSADGTAYIEVQPAPTSSSTAQIFFVKEVSAPTGYAINNTPYSVTVNFETNLTKATAAWVNDGTAIENIPTPPPSGGEGSAKIVKVDSKTGKQVGPATFKLTGTQYDDPYLDPDTYSPQVGTAYNATIQTGDDGVYEIQWMDPAEPNYIPPGQYTVQEITAPEGYERATRS